MWSQYRFKLLERPVWRKPYLASCTASVHYSTHYWKRAYQSTRRAACNTIQRSWANHIRRNLHLHLEIWGSSDKLLSTFCTTQTPRSSTTMQTAKSWPGIHKMNQCYQICSNIESVFQSSTHHDFPIIHHKGPMLLSFQPMIGECYLTSAYRRNGSTDRCEVMRVKSI